MMVSAQLTEAALSVGMVPLKEALPKMTQHHQEQEE